MFETADHQVKSAHLAHRTLSVDLIPIHIEQSQRRTYTIVQAVITFIKVVSGRDDKEWLLLLGLLGHGRGNKALVELTIPSPVSDLGKQQASMQQDKAKSTPAQRI